MPFKTLMIFIYSVVHANPVDPEPEPETTTSKVTNKDESVDDTEEDSPTEDENTSSASSSTFDDPTASSDDQLKLKEPYNWQPLTPDALPECSDRKHLFQYPFKKDSERFGAKDEIRDLHDSLQKLKVDHNVDSSENSEDESGNADKHATPQSWGTLSADNLSVDARALANPRKGKGSKKRNKDKKPKSESAKSEENGLENSPKGSNEADDDVKNYIRKFCMQQRAKRPEIKFFDAAIVYDKRDYDQVVELKNELTEMMHSEGETNIRIELFDSDEFAQSKITVVQDLVERCSAIFVYLSENFNSAESMFLVEEAVGLSRLELGRTGQTDSSSGDQRWVLKPVHTQSRKFRKYKTPTGLLTVNGIDWFDRASRHTRNTIVTILKSAISVRKQRSNTVNTDLKYREMFGKPSAQPQLGPPFDVSVAHRMTLMSRSPKMSSDPYPRMPYHMHNPLNTYHSQDAMSFAPSFAMPPRYPSHQPQDIFGEVPYVRVAETYATAGQDPSLEGTVKDPAFDDQRFMPRVSRDSHIPNQYFSQQQGYPSHLHSMAQPEIPYQTARLDNNVDYQRYQRLPDSQTAHGFSAHVPIHRPIANQKYEMPYRMATQNVPASPNMSPLPQNCQYDGFQNQPVSRDALDSTASNILQNQTPYAPDNTHLRVVSKVTGKLITTPNLSTDDVEIDSFTDSIGGQTFEVTSGKHSGRYTSKPKKSQRGKRVVHRDDETSDSSDVEDENAFGDLKTKKSVNIVKCRIVQLGSGNAVYKSNRKKKPKDERSGKKGQQMQDEDVSGGERVVIRRYHEVEQSPQRLLKGRIQTENTSLSQKSTEISDDAMSLRNNMSSGQTTKIVNDKVLQFNNFGNSNPDPSVRELNSPLPVTRMNDVREFDSVTSSNNSVSNITPGMNATKSITNEADCASSYNENNTNCSFRTNDFTDDQLFGNGFHRNQKVENISKPQSNLTKQNIPAPRTSFLALESKRKRLAESILFLNNSNPGDNGSQSVTGASSYEELD